LKQPRIHSRWCILADVLCSIVTWICFYFLRAVIYDYAFTVPPGFYLGMVFYVLGWLALHLLSGAYESIYQKATITEFFRTLLVSMIGCLGLLFFFILKNPQENNSNYYKEFFALLLPVFLTTMLLRLFFLRVAARQVQRKSVWFNILLIGSGRNATDFFESFSKADGNSGYQIRSFLNTNGKSGKVFPQDVRCYMGIENLQEILRADAIEEVVITVEKENRALLTTILQQLSDKDVNIKITPDAVDIISGAVQTSNVMGVPLIDVHSGLFPLWQKNIKRLIDITVSVLAALVFSPLLLYAAIRTALSSQGGIIYRQERIGYKGIPFTIYKFRSMIAGAEGNGPMLSSEDDKRITRWGKVMRTWRIDELPQLWNIFIGEMSLVGPRPERKFYIDQIVRRHPEFRYLYKVKPGLTSWGMVKFGYAGSVEEMIRRMPYDLMYVENASILLDLRIMFHTMLTILKGKGM
jgi:exopolysaccharide biosynthesis polyprenyl glycosylphosphotransferase